MALLYCGGTDNGATVAHACYLLLNGLSIQEDYPGNEENFKEEGFHCQDHVMDLFLKESIDEVPEVSLDISLIRKLMVAVHGSPQLHEELNHYLKSLNIPLLSPILDV